MCGRFKLSADHTRLYEEFGIGGLPADYAPRYNIAPTQPVLSIITTPGGWEAMHLRWGLIPHWAKDASGSARRINARAESLSEKPAFREAFQRRRCLILADGFYEWTEVDGRRQPVHIRRRDGRPFAFAGLWEGWRSPGGEPLHTCTIVTTTPNDVLRTVHDRMPVILTRRTQEIWMDTDATPDHLQALLAPYTEHELEVFPVSPLVNSAANDLPACAEAIHNGIPAH
jgi:putative SOS response-associated peptidase YedK